MHRKILYIHDEKRIKFGANYINELIVQKLRKSGYVVDTIYPKQSITMFSKSLKGITNILFFYSLINKKFHSKKYKIIQGTTYTVLPFLDNGVKVVSHFGSTTFGFLKSVPSTKKLASEKKELLKIFSKLKKRLNITDYSVSIKSLQDINKIKIEVARKSDAVIATSKKVKRELVKCGVKKEKIFLVHNAIEDYWFKTKIKKSVKQKANLVYLGRMGDDTFTIKLKGISRLFYVLKRFPENNKKIIGMCHNVVSFQKFFLKLPNTQLFLSLKKDKIPQNISENFGDIYINTGRYEGFCLSLVEAMSQGIVPITFSIGVVPEIIKNGKNGYIVKSLDEMVKKINYLQNKPKLRKKMALNAVKTSKQFNSNDLVKKLDKIYSSLVKN